MNYGKKSTSKKRKALTSRSSMIEKRAHVSALRILFIALITLGIIVIFGGIGAFKGVIDNAPDVDDIDIMPLGYASFLYDGDGNQIRKLAAPDANRLPVSIDDIPLDLQHAVVAIEDERFYEHNGIDVRGILRAFVKGVSDGTFSEGASTITQQLLKNNVFTDWTNESTWLEKFTRKFQEQYLAIQVEKKINDKDVILENYLNTINLGAGSYGVQAAAQRYFGKDVKDLNLSECATIAGITQNPTKYNPITNPDDNAKRRKQVLNNMLEQGYISQSQYDEALADDVYSRIQQTESQTTTKSVYSYFEDEVIDQAVDALVSIKGYTETQARNALYSGGLDVYTTLDPDIQSILDEEYADPDNFPSGTQYSLDFALTVTNPEGEEVNYSKEMLTLYFKNQDPDFDLLFDSPEEGQTYVDQYKASIVADGSKVIAERVSFSPQPQSSMSIMDPNTGYVKALIGGRGEKTASLTLNRATDTTRQPGSTFKILSTYAPALNEKGMTLATTFEDEPYEYPDGTPVKNSNNSYGGETTIRKAIQNSVNIVAVKCLEEVTPNLGLDYLDSFGFTTLAHGDASDTDADGNVYSDANLPLALGGITYGVTNVELNAAYSAIANGGNYIKPIYFTKILDREGNVLIDNTPEETEVVKESTAWLLTSAMEDVVKYGTGTACQLNNMPVAGKTGTTDTYNDLWFVGYTPYYSCAVWSGYDNNEKIPDDYMSRNFHKLLWQKVMSRLHEDLDYKDFEQPPTVEKETVCSETGLLPRSGCPTVTEYFDITSMPTQRCDKHYYTYTPSTDYDRNDSSSGSSNTDNNSDTSDEDEDTTQDDPGTTPGGDSGDTPGDDGSGGSGGGDTSGDNPGGDTGGDDSGGSGDGSGDSEGTS
ncbi:MAG: transglycosylase domain-containing protein [Blautia sp.]|mgnify:CR=1 FL=1